MLTKLIDTLLEVMTKKPHVTVYWIVVWFIVWTIYILDSILQVKIGTAKTKLELLEVAGKSLFEHSTTRMFFVGEKINLRITSPHWSGCYNVDIKSECILTHQYSLSIVPKENEKRRLSINKDYLLKKYYFDKNICLDVEIFRAGCYLINLLINSKMVSSKIVDLQSVEMDPGMSIVETKGVRMLCWASDERKMLDNLLEMCTHDKFNNPTNQYNLKAFTYEVMGAGGSCESNLISYKFYPTTYGRVRLKFRHHAPGIFKACVKYAGNVISRGEFCIVAISNSDIRKTDIFEHNILIPAAISGSRGIQECQEAFKCKFIIKMETSAVLIDITNKSGFTNASVYLHWKDIRIRLLKLGGKTCTFLLSRNSFAIRKCDNLGINLVDGTLVKMSSDHLRVFLTCLGIFNKND